MIEWRDEGFILSTRKHGESAAIVDVFTKMHGRHSGVVRGGAGRKMAPILQVGSQVEVVWKARLEEHIGAYTVEPLRSRSAQVLGDPLALAGFSSTLALLEFALPERQGHRELYDNSVMLLDVICTTQAWPLAYLQWEMMLLRQLGFGLDLGRCAVGGENVGLAYVSPKSGAAVCAHHAGAWAARLLPLPPCMIGQGENENKDIFAALGVTGYFLENGLAPSLGHKPLPEARARFLDRLQRAI